MIPRTSRWRLLWRATFPPGARVAAPPLVFFAVVAVSLFQIPSQLLISSGLLAAGIILNEVAGVAGVPLLLAYLQRFEGARLFPRRWPKAGEWVGLALFMLGAVILMDYATAASETLFPLPLAYQQRFDELMAVGSSIEFLWKLGVLCLLPGICEEIFFRGFCQGSLREVWGDRTAMIAAAIIFSLLHGNPYYVHLLFLLGLLFGWVFATTNSLWAAIFCHAFNNSWTFVNHVRGVKFPLGGERWPLDVAIVAVGAALFVAGVVSLRRPRRT